MARKFGTVSCSNFATRKAIRGFSMNRFVALVKANKIVIENSQLEDGFRSYVVVNSLRAAV